MFFNFPVKWKPVIIWPCSSDLLKLFHLLHSRLILSSSQWFSNHCHYILAILKFLIKSKWLCMECKTFCKLFTSYFLNLIPDTLLHFAHVSPQAENSPFSGHIAALVYLQFAFIWDGLLCLYVLKQYSYLSAHLRWHLLTKLAPEKSLNTGDQLVPSFSFTDEEVRLIGNEQWA